MKVLVTGGTGYLGAAIVRALARHGHTPIVFSRRASGSGLPGTLLDGDVRDRDAVSRAARGSDAICHAAALVSLWQPRPQDFDDVNVGGLRHVLEAARAHQVRRVIYTSSFLALPPAGRTTPLAANDYQRTKVLALQVARGEAGRGLPLTTLFPGVIYGPGLASEGNLVGRLVRDHMGGRLPGIVGGERTWSLSHVEDVARAHVAALEVPPGGELVVGGENVPQRRIFEILQRLKGIPPPRAIPPLAAGLAGRLLEWRAGMTGRPPLLTAGAVEIFRHDWPLDSAESTTRIGYAITGLEAGLAATLEEIVR